MFVIASNRPWHRHLPGELSQRTERPFGLIDSRELLTPDHLRHIAAEAVFLPHWSYLIPPEVYEAFQCVVFHMTDLPYGRGGSPLQNLIVRGHRETVISALRCSSGLDAGPIYMKRSLSLLGSAQEIFLRATDVIADMIVEFVDRRPEPQPQAGEPVLFTRRTPEQGNWSEVDSLDQVFDYIRMLDAEGYPPAFVRVGPFRLDFSRASRRNGAVLADVRITRVESDQD